jgi:2-C-methyl-D-erythritol 2,4-cyclodiphosphate synthase
MEIRVGQGFDVHRVGADPGRPLVLGGCLFPGMPGLVGHSDGDAIAHAVAEALLGAAGLGDIGQRFPDTDPALAGADSIGLLRKVVAAVRAEGWSVGNADCSVICEAPKLAPMRDEMQAKLSDAAGAPVSVKGRRPEQLGALGRGEGIACFAVAVLTRGAP